ncbi:retropepsin-like aspartic protease family protein [Thiohalobacter sp.]|uniref:retropepsin-like aspartic protease family protein n=1 Tax=Thiohalobacter sp. TaxID=2025948 RepID=UPI00260503B8|nr:TIGR02281 family clan AA aspartic protease [Thiohalobacter sp.]
MDEKRMDTDPAGQVDTSLRKWITTGFFLLVWGIPVLAADIEVLALFGQQAIVRVDGVQHRLRIGQRTPDGLELVAVEDGAARFRHEGRELRVRLGARARELGEAARADAGAQVVIWRDRGGMFRTIGSINGFPVKFLVDTGASMIAMNGDQARRLGIDFRVEGEPVRVMTASRAEPAWRIRLDRVRVGSIELNNVEAVVLEGPNPRELLLGMSFLGRLRLANEGDHLVLRKRY